MFERFKVDLPVRFLCKETNKEGKGRIINISAGGGGLIITTEELNIGMHLEMWIDIPDDKDPLYITGVVVWFAQIEPQSFRVGVQFDKVDFMSMWRILNIIKP
jgi:hypothetical protein